MDYEDKLLKLGIDGVEMCFKVSGTAIKHIAVMVYAMMKENKRTKGKVSSLTNLLKKTGGKIDIFSLNTTKEEFRDKLAKELKKFGILYKMKVDSKAGKIDIIVPDNQGERFVRACQKAGIEFNRSGIVETVVVRDRNNIDNDLNTLFNQAMPMDEYVANQSIGNRGENGKKLDLTEIESPLKNLSKEKTQNANEVENRQTDLTRGRISVKAKIEEIKNDTLTTDTNDVKKEKTKNVNIKHTQTSGKKKSKKKKKDKIK